MSPLALISLLCAVGLSVKAMFSILGLVIYNLDQERQARDVVLKRQKRFKWFRYVFLAIVFWVLTITQIKIPSVQIKQTQSLELPTPHE